MVAIDFYLLRCSGAHLYACVLDLPLGFAFMLMFNLQLVFALECRQSNFVIDQPISGFGKRKVPFEKLPRMSATECFRLEPPA